MTGIALMSSGSGGAYAPPSLTISSDWSTPFDLGNYLIGQGWNGVDPVRFTITINAGIVLSSNSAASPALSSNIAFPVGSDINIYNYGYIVGMGGRGGNGGSGYYATLQSGFAGGDAVYASTTLGALPKLYNYGTLAAGGGGGGGAYTNYTNAGFSGLPANMGAAGGGGRSGRTNTEVPLNGYGAYVGTFDGPGPGIAPSGTGNSGGGGGWGGGGSGGSAWPGDWTCSNGGPPGRAIVSSAGFIWPVGYGTYYGAIT